MNMRHGIVRAAYLAAAVMWISPVHAQTKDEKKPAGEAPAAAQPTAAKPAGDKPATAAGNPSGLPAAAAPGAGVDPHMEAWLKASTPGEAHARLKPTEGQWNSVIKQWHDPASEPLESKGTCERKWIMGGRYLEEHYTSDMMGMPFQGMSITGYDNVQKKYFTTWIDNMGTGFMLFTGKCDASGKVFSYTADYADPFTGKMQKMRSVVRIVNDKSQICELYGPGEDSKEFKTMEITHTRK